MPQIREGLKSSYQGETLLMLPMPRMRLTLTSWLLKSWLLNHLRRPGFFIDQKRPVVLWNFINKILRHYNLFPITRKVPERAVFNIGFFLECCYRLFKMNGEPPMTRFVAMQFSRSHYFFHKKAKNDFGYDLEISIERALDLIVRT